MAVPRILPAFLIALAGSWRAPARCQPSRMLLPPGNPPPRKMSPPFPSKLRCRIYHPAQRGNRRRPPLPTRQPPQVVPLTVPRQTSLQVALEKEVRVKTVGQMISARLVDPVYAFDRLVVPAGSEIRGRVTKIEPLSGTRRTLAGLDGDFSPTRNVEVTFTDLVLPDGKHLSLRTKRDARLGAGDAVCDRARERLEEDREGCGVAKDRASQAAGARRMEQRDEAAEDARTHASPGAVCAKPNCLCIRNTFPREQFILLSWKILSISEAKRFLRKKQTPLAAICQKEAWYMPGC